MARHGEPYIYIDEFAFLPDSVIRDALKKPEAYMACLLGTEPLSPNQRDMLVADLLTGDMPRSFYTEILRTSESQTVRKNIEDLLAHAGLYR